MHTATASGNTVAYSDTAEDRPFWNDPDYWWDDYGQMDESSPLIQLNGYNSYRDELDSWYGIDLSEHPLDQTTDELMLADPSQHLPIAAPMTPRDTYMRKGYRSANGTIKSDRYDQCQTFARDRRRR